MPTAGSDNSNLPGMGGVFNTTNLRLYHYAGNNPVRYVGKQVFYDKEIDTVLGKAGDLLYGSYDGAEDKDGNF